MSAPFVDAKNAADHGGDAPPVLGFGVKLFAAGFGDGVEAGFAIVFGSAPLGGDPSLVEEANERGVDRALIDLERFFADLLDAAGDAVAVERAHGGESFEDHEVERALENFGFGIGWHLVALTRCSCGMVTGVWHGSCGVATGNDERTSGPMKRGMRVAERRPRALELGEHDSHVLVGA